MKNNLLELKNLGNTSINWLRAIGINNLEQLEKTGAARAYHEIKQRGIRVSKVLLYALHGALTDTYWNDIDGETKLQLIKQAEKLNQN